MSSYRSAAILLLCLFTLSACKKGEEMLPKTNGDRTSSQASVDKQEPTDAERSAYLKSSRQEIEELQTQIEALGAKAKTASAELKVKLEEQTKKLQTELQQADKTWQKLQTSSAKAWGDLKNTLSKSIEELKQAVKNISNQSNQ